MTGENVTIYWSTTSASATTHASGGKRIAAYYVPVEPFDLESSNAAAFAVMRCG